MRFCFLLPILVQLTLGYDVNVYGPEDIDGLDFEAPGTFNVNGFSYCGCPTTRPTVPEPAELVNTNTNTVELNKILECATSFGSASCTQSEFAELTVNVIEGTYDEVAQMCDASSEDCENANTGDDDDDDGGDDIENLTINLFVPNLCQQNCFLSTTTLTHNGELTSQILGIQEEVFSPFSELEATLSLSGTPLGTLDGGSTITCTGTTTEVAACIATVGFEPFATSPSTRTQTIVISIGVSGRDNTPCERTAQLTLGAVEDTGLPDPFVVTNGATVSEDATISELSCSGNSPLNIANGVTLTVTDVANIACIVNGPGSLVLPESVNCDEGVINSAVSFALSHFTHQAGTCSLNTPLSGVEVRVSGGTLKFLNGVSTVGSVIVISTNARVEFLQTLTVGDLVVVGGTCQFVDGQTITIINVFILGGTFVGGSTPPSSSASPHVVATSFLFEGQFTSRNMVLQIVHVFVYGNSVGSGSRVDVSGTVNLRPPRPLLPDIDGPTNPVMPDPPPPPTGPILAKAVTQQQATADNELNFFLVVEETAKVQMHEIGTTTLGGGADIYGDLNLATDSILAFEGPNNTIFPTVISENSSGGTIDVAQGGTLSLPGNSNGDQFTFGIPTTIEGGGILEVGEDGPVVYDNAIINSTGDLVVGVNPLTVTNGEIVLNNGAGVILEFEEGGQRFGQITSPINAPTATGEQATIDLRNPELLNADNLRGQVVTFVDGPVTGTFVPRSGSYTIGSGNNAVEAVVTANGVSTSQALATATAPTVPTPTPAGGGTAVTPTAPSAVITPAVTPAAATPTTTASPEGDDSDSGLIGGLVGGIGGGVCLLCILAAIAGAAVVAKNKSARNRTMMDDSRFNRGTEGYSPYMDPGFAAQPNTPVGGPIMKPLQMGV